MLDRLRIVRMPVACTRICAKNDRYTGMQCQHALVCAEASALLCLHLCSAHRPVVLLAVVVVVAGVLAQGTKAWVL